MNTPKWNFDVLKEIYNRHAAEIEPILAANAEHLNGLLIDVDHATDTPFLKLVFNESVRHAPPASIAAIPPKIGKPGDELPVRIEYRPMARLA